jgi:outer membrane protein assembly factor BamA
MTHKIFCIFVSLISSFCGFSTETADTISTRSSLFVIPHVSYQQETSWAPGVAYGYYFKSDDLSKISSVSGSAVYTFNNQFLFNITPKIFFNSKKWYVYSNLNIKKYPDFYYGIGNAQSSLKQPFVSQNISMQLQTQYILSTRLLLGATCSGRMEKVKTNESFEANQQTIFQKYGTEGWSPFAHVAFGIVATYDSRDNQFYPSRGVFAKSTFSFSNMMWGSTYTLQESSFDFRSYLPIFNNHCVAFQLYGAGVFGENDAVPFQLLPTLGGRDMLRGFRQGQYKDNVLFLFQSEYRMPIYSRVKSALFFSVGDVVDSNSFAIDKLKYAYGVGLRYRLNDARVHLRLDMAINNYDEKLQFYITATEAF